MGVVGVISCKRRHKLWGRIVNICKIKLNKRQETLKKRRKIQNIKVLLKNGVKFSFMYRYIIVIELYQCSYHFVIYI
jgi:hypothetical protein